MQAEATVLVVDDESAILEVYKQYLGGERELPALRSARLPRVAPPPPSDRFDCRLLLASTGEDAVRLVERERAAGRRITAGFFDVKMPGGIDGLETIRRIRQLEPDILCTVVTAYQDQPIDEISKVFGLGHQDEWDYLNKPFTEGEIRQKARNLISSWERRRREEQQRDDLEQLIKHLGMISGVATSDLESFLGYVLRQLVALTASSGGVLTTVDEEPRFVAGAGSLSQEASAADLLREPELRAMIALAATKGAVVGSAKSCVVPLCCAHAPGVAVLLQAAEPSAEQKRLLQIFAHAASTAIRNHQLYGELKEANATLEARVSTRTEDLRRANGALEEKTVELRHMLTTLQETERQLIQNEKLAVIGQLAAGVAHEINNPAAFMIANLEVLVGTWASTTEYMAQLAGGASSEQLQAWRRARDFEGQIAEVPDMLKELREGVDRVVTVVRDLRGFAAVGANEMIPTSIAGVVDKAARILGPQIRQLGDVHADCAGLPQIDAHPGKLLQVFVNLILNGLQAMPHGAPRDAIAIGGKVIGDRVRIEVRDKGTGIAPENLERIFEPFFTTKTTQEGTGLGLSICRSILKQHGGTLTVESALGVGTAMIMELPIKQSVAEAPAAAPSARPATTDSERLHRVLLVDDEPAILRAQQRLLRTTCKTDVASSAAEALSAIKSGNSYDAIICDVTMPGMSGPELFMEVQRLRPELARHFVFLTGGAFAPAAQQFMATTTVPCILKPASPDDLLRMIRQLASAASPKRGGLSSGEGE